MNSNRPVLLSALFSRRLTLLATTFATTREIVAGLTPNSHANPLLTCAQAKLPGVG
jgi:hypothetical protein